MKLLRNLFFLGLAAFFLWLSFRDMPFAELAEKIVRADWRILAFTWLLGFIALASRARRWILLMEPLGYKPRFWTTYHAVMFGYLVNLAIPRLGEISRCASLNKSDKVPFDKLLGTVLTERLSDVLMLMSSIVLVSILEYQRLWSFMQEQLFGPMMTKISGNRILLLATAVIALVLLVGLIRLFRMASPPPWMQKILSLLRGISEGFRSFLHMKNKGAFFFHTAVIWIIYFTLSWVSFYALDSTEHLGAAAGLFVMVLGGIGMTAPVQGGIGTYHWLVSKGLLLYGIAAGDGLVFATLVHSTQTLLLLFLGLLSMIALLYIPVKNASTREN